MKTAILATLMLSVLLAAGCIAASEQVKFSSEKTVYAGGEAVKLKAAAYGGKFYLSGEDLAEVWRFDEKLGVWRQLDLSLGPARKQVCLSTGVGTKLDIVPPEKEPACSRLYSAEWSWNGEFTTKEEKECFGAPYEEYSRQSLPGKYKAVLKVFDDKSCTELNKALEAPFDITD